MEGADYDRAVAAIELLGSDMLSSLDVDIAFSDLETALPDSYTQYSEYVPLYSQYKEEYLDRVSIMVVTLLPNLYDSIYQQILILAKDPASFITDDTSLTIALNESMRSSLIERFASFLTGYTNELSKAFDSSKREFSSIREAYLNLYSVNGGRTLAEAGEVDLDIVATVAIDSMFTALANAESVLKNKVVDRSSNSLYSIFWEVR